MIEIELRKFSLPDLDQIIEVEEISFPNREAYSKSYFETLYQNYPRGFIIAKIGKKIIGYVISQLKDNSAEIISLAVAPDFQKRGIGTKLIKFLINHFQERGLKRFSLHVQAENKTAISFYQNLGFKILKTMGNYYRNGKDAYLMEKEIRVS